LLQYDAVEICNGEVLRNARIPEKNQGLTWAVGNYDWGEGKRDETGAGRTKQTALRPVGAERRWGGLLDLEGASAAAGGFHLRIAELETGAFERLDVVHFGAVEV